MLYVTLHNTQVRRGDGATLVVFLRTAMHPARYVKDRARFDALQQELNEVLVLYGLKVNDSGQLVRRKQGATKLGSWVISQRQHARLGKLSPERVRRLEAVPGWVWMARGRAARG